MYVIMLYKLIQSLPNRQILMKENLMKSKIEKPQRNKKVGRQTLIEPNGFQK